MSDPQRNEEAHQAVNDLRRRYLGLPTPGPADLSDLAAVPDDHPVSVAFRFAMSARVRLRRAAEREARARDVAEVTRAADRRPPRTR